MSVERTVVFGKGGATLVGVLHPAQHEPGTRGVVVVVGGPQYRVGSHRQFVLLARTLARRGIPTLRFDQAGVGDSDGDTAGFEDLHRDLRSAIDELQRREPRVERVCIWGLCDGASAALMYAAGDARVDQLILLNPWVRSEGSLAQAYIDGRLKLAQNWFKTGWTSFNVGNPHGTIVNNGTVTGATPGFVSEAGQDYHLLASSQCIDEGAPLSPKVLPLHG